MKKYDKELEKADPSLAKEVRRRAKELHDLNNALQHELSLRRQKEEDLKRSEERFKELAELLPLGIWEIDDKGVFTFVNHKGLEYMGRTPENLHEGISAHETLIPEDREKMGKNMVKMLKGEKSISEGEYTALRPDGATLPILIYSSPIFSDHKIVGIRGITIDMTERKEAEKALKEGAAKYSAVFNNTGSPTAIIKEDTTFLMVNKCFEDFSGFSREELEGKKSWTEFMGEKDLERANKQHELRKKDPEKGISWFEFDFLDRSGNVKHVIATLEVIPGATNMVASLADITKHKITEETLRQAKESLEKQNLELTKLGKMKDGLLRDVSHELKTPVAKHAMFVEILKSKVECQGSLENFKEIILSMEANIRRQQSVINNILNLSRLEAGGREYQIGSVRLDKILQNVINDYRYAINTYGILIKTYLEEATLESDEEMIWHVFSNLINNAIKYRSRIDFPKIEISTWQSGEEVVIKIDDNGIGLSEKGKRRIFDHFYQETPSSEGIGAGLPMCKMIIEELGGSLTIESGGIGKGTTATVTLPLNCKPR